MANMIFIGLLVDPTDEAEVIRTTQAIIEIASPSTRTEARGNAPHGEEPGDVPPPQLRQRPIEPASAVPPVSAVPINSDQFRSRRNPPPRYANPYTPMPSREEQVLRAEDWLRRSQDDLAPYASAIREHLIQLLKNPPPRVSYMDVRARLGPNLEPPLSDEDPNRENAFGFAWAKVLGNFTANTKVRLLDKQSRPMRHGRQDTFYTVNEEGAGVLREAIARSDASKM